jgi:hypothetical protein
MAAACNESPRWEMRMSHQIVRKGRSMAIVTVGIGLAQNVPAAHGVDAAGRADREQVPGILRRAASSGQLPRRQPEDVLHVSLLPRSEPGGRPGLCLLRLDLPAARLRRSDQRADQNPCRRGHFLDGSLESGFVHPGRNVEAAEFPHELKRRVADLEFRGGWFEVEQRLDVSAHGDTGAGRIPVAMVRRAHDAMGRGAGTRSLPFTRSTRRR